MLRTTLLLMTICGVSLPVAGGCAALRLPAPRWPEIGSEKAPVGTPAWWKKHKKQAVFDPGKGFRVDGVEGYFDEQGRPINARVAKVVDQKDAGGGLLGDPQFQKRMTELKQSVGLGPDHEQAQQDFDAAEDLFRREKYGEAAKHYKEAAGGWPDSQLEQDAMFKQAESYFFAARYPAAEKAYEKLLRKYPNTAHLDKIVTRQFSIARYWEQYQDYDPRWVTTPNFFNRTLPLFDTVGRAMKSYENIRLNDPTGPLADDAIMASANSYFLRGRYLDADEQYDLLRKEYPRSDHQFQAHLLGLKCKMNIYQGPDYDGTPLDEAKVLVKQLKVQFAGKLSSDEKQLVAEADATLNRELALREFKMGQHFDNIEWYGSAKIYYAQLLEDYPNTPLAEQARTRLAAIDGEPEVPKSMLDPVLNILPESAERRATAQVPMIVDRQTRLAAATEESVQPQDGEAGRGATIRK
ncbi:MAG: outer membrane protein assembly factor BamD [Pirellulales bacterium]|nr:outer membrane protein assembly factor BamD [Pirellulales bacterium]